MRRTRSGTRLRGTVEVFDVDDDEGGRCRRSDRAVIDPGHRGRDRQLSPRPPSVGRAKLVVDTETHGSEIVDAEIARDCEFSHEVQNKPEEVVESRRDKAPVGDAWRPGMPRVECMPGHDGIPVSMNDQLQSVRIVWPAADTLRRMRRQERSVERLAESLSPPQKRLVRRRCGRLKRAVCSFARTRLRARIQACFQHYITVYVVANSVKQ